jgi:quercetin dioxygenase-like cupin family protein
MKRSTLILIASGIALCSQAPASYAHDPAAAAPQPVLANPPTNVVKLTVMDTTRMPFDFVERPQISGKIPVKRLHSDKDTGMQIMQIRYQAGFMNPWHTHPHGHGMYVLDGILKTHQGEYGPGNFVWFPEGGWMEHGATAKNDVNILFITNKPFGIIYASDPDHPYPMFK